MPLDFLSGLLEFVLKHKVVVGFYLFILMLLYINRKKFQFQLKFIAIYRTTWGIGLMDRIASRYRELVKLFGYISIGAGFLGMFTILVILGSSVVTLITVPDSPAPLAPVIPGVHIPGTPPEFAVPFVQGIIAIFIIAAVHEFAHGMVARAHNVKIKSSGPAIIGPIFAAFVEPDEQQLKAKGDVVQYSVFAAGSFANFVLAFLMLAVTAAVLVPINGAFFPETGAVIGKVMQDTPAHAAGLKEGMLLKSISGEPVSSRQDVIYKLQLTRPNDTLIFSNGTAQVPVKATSHPEVPGRGYFGIVAVSVYENQGTAFFGIFSWVARLLDLIFKLSLGIAFANMLPIGPIDGGKMLHLALQRIRGEAKANKAFVKFTLLMLLVILFLLSPIFKALLKSAASIF